MSDEQREIVPPVEGEEAQTPDLPATPVEAALEDSFSLPAGDEPAAGAPAEAVFDLPPAEPPATPPLPPPAASAATTTSDDDRLMAALAWLSMVILQLPVVSLVLLLVEPNRTRAFQRYHSVTSILFWVAALAYEILAGIAYTILGFLTLTCGFFCLWPILLVPHALALYYAFQAYNGKQVEIPVLSEFAKGQSWV